MHNKYSFVCISGHAVVSGIIVFLFFTFFTFFKVVAAESPVSPGQPALRILFDDTHGQSLGNADWTVDAAYSDFARDLREQFGASVFSLSRCGTRSFTHDVLDRMDCVILPEPNIRYTDSELNALRNYVMNGGSMFLIADHGGSDRNFSGWDSSLILNSVTDSWGLTFLGDTFSETPVRGNLKGTDIGNWPNEFITRHTILDSVLSVGAWAATSIIPEQGEYPWHVLLSSQTTGLPFFVCGRVGKGRIAAIGDSAAFDDGRGTPGKNRHNAYHSWLYNHRRLAVQTLAWLLQKTPLFIPDTPLPFPDRTLWTLTETHIVIDAARGNNDAGIMDRFGRDLMENTSLIVALNHTDYSDIDVNAIFLLPTPDIPLSEADVETLADWVLAGGRLILPAVSSRNPISSIVSFNALLTRMNSTIRVQSDQIVNDQFNTGTPWSLLVTHFADLPDFSSVNSAVFWSCASLNDDKGNTLLPSDTVTILAKSPENSKSNTYKQDEDSVRFRVVSQNPVPDGQGIAAMESVGKGYVVVLGANPFTNFQYPDDWEKQHMEQSAWDHHTARFNLSLIAILERFRMEKTNS